MVEVGATETLATALVGYSVTVLTSSENCLARPGEEKDSIKSYYLSLRPVPGNHFTNTTVLLDSPDKLTSVILCRSVGISIMRIIWHKFSFY